ncbi:putative FBD-associated F-box protein At5g56440 [Rosa chinensis]|uniref:putative FBD-associated F-box protein At5g56440 n=1 Tax=Rosa chinensis TaxID=74649 RepID=UPI001AD9225F|nr:putative FBD-associated F-box protein At5g56440 [Rosa chinensis]
MGSNSKLFKPCIEDRISGLPDAILFHIISFLETRDAVKTFLLSHRWNNVWTYVPNLEVYVSSPKYDSDEHVGQAGFVDRVLLFRNLSNIHKFRLICLGIKDYFDRIDAWVCTAIRRNVVELELDLYTTPSNSYTGCLKLPTSIFICKTLVYYPVAVDSVAKLFSCCFSALEGLIIHGNLGRLRDDKVLNLTIPAPKLKRLQMRFCAVPEDDPYARDGGYEYKNFVNANAPNLEKFNVKYLLASYSLKNDGGLMRRPSSAYWVIEMQLKEKKSGSFMSNFVKKILSSTLSLSSLRAVYRWTLDPADCDAVLANLAIKKPDCNYNVIIEIFSVRCPEELLAVRKAYQLRYKCSLEEDLAQRTNGDLHKTSRSASGASGLW